MSAESFQVIFTGALQPGKDAERIVELFSEKFKLERAVADKLVRAGRPVVLKKGLDLEKAEKYLSVLRLLGMVVELDPKPKPPEPAPPPAPKIPQGLALEPLDNGGDDTTEVLEPADGVERCPKCGSVNMVMGICQDCGIVAAKYLAAQSRQAEAAESSRERAQETANPYIAPGAELEQPLEGEMSGPRSVPAGDGFSWIGQGWGYFKGSPVGWILALVLWGLISGVVGMIPILGGIALTLLGPVVMAGFMLGCRDQDEGGSFSVSHLFAGFSHNAGQLVLVGLLWLVMLIVAVVVLSVVMALTVGFGSLGMGAEDPQVMPSMAGGMVIFFIVLMVLFLISIVMTTMAYIFAPPLVAFEDINAIEAMKLSFSGCLKNLLPLTLYGIAGTMLALAAVIPMLLGLFDIIPVWLGFVLYMIFGLALFPTLTASLYGAYRDIYYTA